MLQFNRGQGGLLERQQVYYSWRYAGRWSPAVPTLNEMTRGGGMYKVHVARPLGPAELTDPDALEAVDGPCEAFLRVLLPEIERRLAAAGPARPGLAAPEGR